MRKPSLCHTLIIFGAALWQSQVLPAVHAADAFMDVQAGATAAEVRQLSTKDKECEIPLESVGSGEDLPRRILLRLKMYSHIGDPKAKVTDAECMSLYWRLRLFTVLVDASPDSKQLRAALSANPQLPLTPQWAELTGKLMKLAAEQPMNEYAAQFIDRCHLVADALEAELKGEMEPSKLQPAAIVNSKPGPTTPIRTPQSLPVRPVPSQRPGNSNSGNPDAGNPRSGYATAANASGNAGTPGSVRNSDLDKLIEFYLLKSVEKHLARALTEDERKAVINSWRFGKSLVEIAAEMLADELGAPLGRDVRPDEEQFAWKRWEELLGERYWKNSTPVLPSASKRAELIQVLAKELKLKK